MSRAFAQLTCADLRALAAEARDGRLARPYSSITLGRRLGPLRAEVAAAEMEALGLDPSPLSLALSLLATEREAIETHARRLQLVWTGPELPGSQTRDTLVVVRELFRSAEASVLASGFAVYQGKEVFETLAKRMVERPSLRVSLFLNIQRPDGSREHEHVVVREFVDHFQRKQWPGEKAPDIYYDPRALGGDKLTRAVLHAKCIVVDDHKAFVTSANLTTAAQERNIEAGILVEDAGLAESLRMQFETLVRAGILKQAFPAGGP
jgi:phosphatidylserine/phosphatidylglycerophosphate/cardiolipin synthase-like enzyme